MSGHLGPRIGDLLSGRLSPEEQRGFEEHLKICKECTSELSWAREFREQALRHGNRHIPTMRIVELARMRTGATTAESEHLAACSQCGSEIQWVEELPATGDADEESEGETDTQPDHSRSAPGRTMHRWLWAGLAAAAVLVILIIPRAGAPDLSGLASLEPLPVMLSRSIPSPGSFEAHRLLGLEAYSAADYSTAAEHLSDALALRQNDPEMLLYLGSTQFLLGDAAASLESLERARAEAADGVVKEAAGWQLANALLVVRRNTDAERILDEIASGKGRRRIDAAKLLDLIRADR
jgi:hypothetical protein